ncbi:hypothetical protein Oweho_0461 [Owenweeksia hongkongensis DSM 17368]|uniref:DUF58 domain-containing protein n=1 Tax=Owenweeksia hongkongensis (strain DSM 17368 / CIP 108786 / JCM 12287 / NRRL B-23963 / UST20020801) TaxID=926562 RepID=G8QZ96_OWEHD|nr:DUF58 domain-containing protein [Owenweeksia hongkongensis]AEV31479.1 hypothetical protein Oweho_0461 [Owenweeksia hongkongensis DSM 17368]
MKFLKPIFLKNRVFYLLGFASLLFALGFSWPWLVYIGFITLATLFIGIAIDLQNSAKQAQFISISRKVPKHFSMSDFNEVKLLIKNTGSHSVSIRIIDELPLQFQKRDFEVLQKVESESSEVHTYSLKPLTRGEYVFHNTNVFFTGKFGLVEYRKTISAKQIVKVYPSFEQMRKFELMLFNTGHTQDGIRKTPRIGHGYEFGDIRQYVPGDDPRSINWKASSRVGHMMVNNYQEEKSQKVYAIIDKSRVMRMPFEGLSLMDYAINTSLTILNIALRNQDNVGLITFSKELESFIPAQRRNNQIQKILDSLYVQTEGEYESNFQGLYESLRTKVKSRSMLLLFTNFMSLNALQRALPELKRINRDHLLVVVFFENTELQKFKSNKVTNLFDIASQTMAQRLSEELDQVMYELQKVGIQTIKTKPEDLTANTINKYLELKSRGLM